MKLEIIGSSDIALRPFPDKGEPYIRALSPGTVLTYVETVVTTMDLWVKVITEDGTEGWCVQRYTREVE